jgi:S-adenosylmethionine synthetase
LTRQVSYAIGVAEPISITVFDYGTSDKSPKELMQIVKDNFDLRPGKIVKYVTYGQTFFLIFIGFLSFMPSIIHSC